MDSLGKETPSTVLSGWKRIETSRKKGLLLNSGKTIISYRSPDGEIVTTKERMQEMLKNKIDLSGFDFRAGTFSAAALTGNKRKPYSFASLITRNGDLSRPLRRTSPMFEKPISVFLYDHPCDPEAISAQIHPMDPAEYRESLTRRPAQVFWQKRLVKSNVTTEKGLPGSCTESSLPEKVHLMDGGLYLTPASIYHSVGALSCDRYNRGTGGLFGQPEKVDDLNRHPNVFMACDQPPVAPERIVNEEDIMKQEKRIENIRENLVEAIKEYEKLGHEEEP